MPSSYKGGYMGKVLEVDLSTGKIGETGLPADDVLRNMLAAGGWV
jgi:aldehyde:ferredoxin oxidoreductase